MSGIRQNRGRPRAVLVLKIAALCALLLLYFASALRGDALSTSARGALLMDGATGRVLYEHNADLRMPMASTTKIMTALVALEHGSLDDMVMVSDTAVRVEGSSMYLKAGESLPMEHLLYGLMMHSGNDAANAIAEHVASDNERFVAMMNKKARELGLRDTSFANPHGLDNENHYTTARELAVITRAALENPDFLRISATDSITLPMEGGGSRYLNHHHRLVKEYDGLTGGKTGYTRKSGRSLVTMCERDGVTLIAVTINDPNDWKDHRAMLDNGFERVRVQQVSEAGQLVGRLPIAGGVMSEVGLYADSDVAVTLVDDDTVELKAYLPRYMFAPVSDGDVVGRVCFFAGGSQVGETLLRARGTVDARAVTPNPERIFIELLGGVFGAI